MMSMSTSMMSNSGMTGAATAPAAVQSGVQAQTSAAPAANQAIRKDTVTLSAQALELAGGK